MTTRNPRTLAVAFALAATAVAAPTDAGSAREMRTAVVSYGGTVLRAEHSANPAADRREGLIRASFAAPRAGVDPGRREPGNRFPGRGLWATLLAGLLGVVTIARRRMS
jgi:hypothetical protein